MKEIEITADAHQYLDRLMTEAVNIRVDQSVEFTLEKPSFYDEKLFKRAQNFFVANRFAIFGGMMTGLFGLLSVSSVANILIGTDKSSNVYTAYRRYIGTIFHVINWFRYKLEPNTNSWKSLVTVRKLHAYASKGMEDKGVGFISQKDMAFTQFAFMGFPTVQSKVFGVQYNKEDFDAFCHFWRVIGYMLDIKDEYNLCSNSFVDTASRLEAIRFHVYRPNLTNPKATFKKLARPATEGLWCFEPVLEYNSYAYWTKYASDVEGFDYFKESGRSELLKLSYYSRTMLWLLVYVHGVFLNFSFLRILNNAKILLSEALIRYFPFLAFFKFGIRKAYVKIF